MSKEGVTAASAHYDEPSQLEKADKLLACQPEPRHLGVDCEPLDANESERRRRHGVVDLKPKLDGFSDSVQKLVHGSRLCVATGEGRDGGHILAAGRQKAGAPVTWSFEPRGRGSGLL
jgi:hypothetical protein